MSEHKQTYGNKQRHILTLDMYFFSDDPIADAEQLAEAIEKMHEVTRVEVQSIDSMPFGAKKSVNIFTKTK